MARTRVNLDRRGVRSLLQSDEVKADLNRRAESIAAAAGEGYEADSDVGRNRARASVRTVTLDAVLQEADDHSLLRAVDAGRH